MGRLDTHGQVFRMDEGDPSEAQQFLGRGPRHALVCRIRVDVLRLMVAHEHRPLAKPTRDLAISGLTHFC